MRKFIISWAWLLLIFEECLNAQYQFRISGFVKDKSSNENLIGANITLAQATKGTTTDYNGYFSISSINPAYLDITFIGYESKKITLDIKNDTIINIFLIPDIEVLSEVTVSATKTLDFNISTLNNSQLKQIPALGGKPDVIKALQLMPGISTMNEGTSLMLVRGGDPGQNLYLFDNVPVIYVNHLGGFTSVFNPDIINNIDVYKGGFPSRYGGKLSSVIDIIQKEGNSNELKGSYSIGVTDASLTFEGPMKIKNMSFILTGRKTMIDPIMILLSGFSNANDFVISYGFHDFNGKLTWRPKANKYYSLNIYQGDDYLNHWSKNRENGKHHFGNIWGNFLVSLHHGAAISPELYASNNISLTRYRLRESVKYSLTDIDTVEIQKRYRSVVQDLSYKTDLKYNINNDWLAEFGLQLSYLRFAPNDTYYSKRKVSQYPAFTNSIENALYLDNKITFFKNSLIIPGIRIVNYISKNYIGSSFEPRLNITVGLSSDHTVNASYMKVSQFSHLILITGEIMNNEIWIPAGKKVAPAGSEQYTIGWKAKYLDGKFTSEVNIYYKNLFNLSAFKEGYTSLAGDNNWISKIESGGKGNSYGFEALVKKNTGKWTGFVSYSFSRSTRQFPNINNGEEYTYEYDRPNSLSININHNINDKLKFNIIWIYQTGLPFTKAIGRQYLPPLEVNWDGNKYYYEGLIYGKRNSERMKDYHRLDIGLVYSILTKRSNRAELSFSIYNAYNRHNPVYYYYNSNNSGEIYMPEHFGEFKPVSLYQLSLFPIIPSISYKVYFNKKSSAKKQDNLFYRAIPEKSEKARIPFKLKLMNWLYFKT